MNYLKAIDDEINSLLLRLDALRNARVIVASLSEERVQSAQPRKERKVGKPYKTKGGMIRNPGAAGRAREHIITYLSGLEEPVSARLISQMLLGYNIKDTTMWNVLKTLRDEGAITWDSEARLYSITPMLKQGKAVAS